MLQRFYQVAFSRRTKFALVIGIVESKHNGTQMSRNPPFISCRDTATYRNTFSWYDAQIHTGIPKTIGANHTKSLRLGLNKRVTTHLLWQHNEVQEIACQDADDAGQVVFMFRQAETTALEVTATEVRLGKGGAVPVPHPPLAVFPTNCNGVGRAGHPVRTCLLAYERYGGAPQPKIKTAIGIGRVNDVLSTPARCIPWRSRPTSRTRWRSCRPLQT